MALGLGRLSLTALAGSGSGVPALPAQTFRLGINPGNTSAEFVTDYEAWLGTTIDFITLHTGREGWDDYLGSIGYVHSLFNNVRHYKWSIPLFITGGTLSAAAAGDYDAHWTDAATAILACSPAGGQIDIRPGWEFNIAGQPWYSGDGGQTDYIAGFQRFHACFMAVSDRFVFTWCTGSDQAGEDPELSYPGDDYVDYIGMDFYTDPSSSDPNGFWTYHKTATHGLDWLVGFAATHGKPVAIDEWAVGKDGWESYIASAAAYFAANNFAYASWWESDSAYEGMLSDGSYPTTGAEYLKDFGPPEITSSETTTIAGGDALSWELAASKPLTWQIIGGADRSKFGLADATLSLPAKDYSDPTDVGGDNVYDVKLRAVDNRRKYVTQDFSAEVIEASEPWTPTELGTDVVGWFDADDDTTITQAGGIVSAMASRAGSFSATQGTAGFRPGYSETGRNGKPAILFDGTNDCLAFTPPASFPDGSEAYTMICVGYNDGTGVFTTYNGKTIFQYGSGTSVLRGIDRNGTGNAAANVDDTYVNNVGDWDAKDAMVLVEKAAGASALATVYVNDNATGTGTTGAGSLSASAGRIGANVVQTTTAFWPGSIQEILVINRVLTTTERQKMFGYLAHKWGLTALLPSGHPYKSAPPEL
jgi:hypothetical protein